MIDIQATEIKIEKSSSLVLGPISMHLKGAGITAIIGPNGAGKTSLLRALYGLDALAQGRVSWGGYPTPPRRQAFVFQSPFRLRRSCLDNIAYPLRLAGLGRSAAREQARARAQELGLQLDLLRPAAGLSSGEAQKMALARALIVEPEVLYLDEPCANLDGGSIREIEKILRDQADAGLRVIMATHDIAQARRLADDLMVLAGGLLVESGAATEVFAAPQNLATQALIEGRLVE